MQRKLTVYEIGTSPIDVLVLESAVVPAVPLLRSAFEAWLALEYILEDASQYSARALSFVAYYATKRLEGYRSLTSAQFGADRANDVYGARITDPDSAGVAGAVLNLEQLLGKAHLRPFREEYDRLRAKNGRGAPRLWPELHGGPASLYALAKKLHHPLTYRFLYGHWSGIGHAQDLARFFVHRKGEGSAIRRLREPDELLGVSGTAVGFLIDASRKMLVHFRAGEEDAFRRWYVENVQTRFRSVTGIDQPAT